MSAKVGIRKFSSQRMAKMVREKLGKVREFEDEEIMATLHIMQRVFVVHSSLCCV